MEANKFMDLLKPKNYWRYIKKGFGFGILFAIVTWLIRWVMSIFNGGIPIKIDSTAQLGALSGGVLVAVALGAVVAYGIAGFLIEYISNSSAGLIKWLNK